jgi:hypothetical protein
MPLKRWVLGLLMAVGCERPPSDPPSHPPPGATPEGPRVQLRGELVGIRFQNLNKALGHYTYYVDLLVQPVDGPPKPGPMGHALGEASGPLPVRLPERYVWDAFTDPERASLSPDGPRQTLTPTAWAEFSVPSRVDITVVFSGPHRAHLVRDEAPSP